MRRRTLISLIAAAVVLFVVISVLVAHAVGVGDAQTAAVTDLVRAEARGDTATVISLIDGCKQNTACRARAAQLTTTLKRQGAVSVLQVTPSTNFSVTGSVGTARVAWLAGNSLPRVQCVRVRNAGNVFSGFTIELQRITGRLASNAECPSRF